MNITTTMSNTTPDAVSDSTRFFSGGRAVLLLIALVWLTYANALGGDFVFDDRLVIVENNSLREWSTAFEAFNSHVWKFREYTHTEDAPPPYYRPLHTIYMTVCYHLFGLWSQGWHLMSLLVHTLVVLAVYDLLMLVTNRTRLTSFFAAALFAVHPTRSESVAWISGVTDPLAALFYVPTLSCYLRFRTDGKRRWLALSLASYALALSAKEPSLALLLVLAGYEAIRFFSKEGETRNIRTTLMQLAPAATLFVAVSLAYVVARSRALAGIVWTHGISSDTSPHLVLLTIPRVVAEHLLHQLVPLRLSLVYRTDFVRHPLDLEVLLPLLIMGAIAWILWRQRAQLTATTWFGLLLIVTPLAPALNLFVFHREWIVQDRYFYLPSIGFYLIVVEGACRLRHAVRKASITSSDALHDLTPSRQSFLSEYAPRVVLVLLITVCALLTALQNNIWRDSVALWGRAVERAPSSWSANFNLASAYGHTGDHHSAIKYFVRARRAAESPAHLSQTLNNLSVAFSNLKDYDRAEATVREAIELRPDLMEAYNNLGVIKRHKGDDESAINCFRKALELVPGAIDARVNIARTLLALGRAGEAIPHYKIAVRDNPDDLVLRYVLAQSYAATGEKEQARRELLTVLERTDDPETRANVSDRLGEIN